VNTPFNKRVHGREVSIQSLPFEMRCATHDESFSSGAAFSCCRLAWLDEKGQICEAALQIFGGGLQSPADARQPPGEVVDERVVEAPHLRELAGPERRRSRSGRQRRDVALAGRDQERLSDEGMHAGARGRVACLQDLQWLLVLPPAHSGTLTRGARAAPAGTRAQASCAPRRTGSRSRRSTIRPRDPAAR